MQSTCLPSAHTLKQAALLVLKRCTLRCTLLGPSSPPGHLEEVDHLDRAGGLVVVGGAGPGGRVARLVGRHGHPARGVVRTVRRLPPTPATGRAAPARVLPPVVRHLLVRKFASQNKPRCKVCAISSSLNLRRREGRDNQITGGEARIHGRSHIICVFLATTHR